MNGLYLVVMILIQLVIGSIWLRLIIRMDRHRKKKHTEQALLQLFALGMLSAAITAAIYRVLPYWLGISGNYLIDDFLTNVVMVGPVEEFSKFIVFYIVVRKLDSIHEPTDGLLQGATVGLAFALVENVMYTWWWGPGVIPYRSIFNVAGHMSYAALWGVLYVIITMSKTHSDQKIPFRLYLLAIVPAGLVHGLYNYLLNYGIRYGLLIKGIVIALLLIVYRYSVKQSPYRKFDPREHATAIPSIMLSLNANPNDTKLNYRLMLYCIYAGKLDLAAESVVICLSQNRGNPILQAWYGIIDILRGDDSVGKDGLAAAVGKATDRQKAILLGSIQQVVRNPRMRSEISRSVTDLPERLRT